MTTRPGDPRLEELLVSQATEGLDLELQAELDALLAASPDQDPEAFELAAAAAELAYSHVEEPLPASLRHALSTQARAYEVGSRVLPFAQPEPAVVGKRPAVKTSGGWLGWAAAAACLALAALGWLPRLLDSEPGGLTAPQRTVAEARSLLIAEGEGTLRLPWTGTDDPLAAPVYGDVVWSSAEQKGYMHFHGLAVNDPSEYQYQLWIFDAEQDERYPIDGGVFDVLGEDVVVRIDPKIAVTKPALFAITVEKPGGVVVSSRERLVLLAQAT